MAKESWRSNTMLWTRLATLPSLAGGSPAKVSMSGYEEMRYRQARGSPPEPAPPDPPHHQHSTHHHQRPGLSKASTMPGPGSHTSLEELTCRNSHSCCCVVFQHLNVLSQHSGTILESSHFRLLVTAAACRRPFLWVDQCLNYYYYATLSLLCLPLLPSHSILDEAR